MKNGIVTDEYGDYYYENDLLHRLDGPAVEYKDGGKEYWVKGKKHRINGPAIELDDEIKFYYKGYLIDVNSLNDFQIIVQNMFKPLELKAFW